MLSIISLQLVKPLITNSSRLLIELSASLSNNLIIKFLILESILVSQFLLMNNFKSLIKEFKSLVILLSKFNFLVSIMSNKLITCDLRSIFEVT